MSNPGVDENDCLKKLIREGEHLDGMNVNLTLIPANYFVGPLMPK